MLLKLGLGRSIRHQRNSTVYYQGDPADALFYVTAGRILLTTVSSRGKESVLGVVGAGEFLGESCVAEDSCRTSSALALENSLVIRVERQAVRQLLLQSPGFAQAFIDHLLARNRNIQEDMADLLSSPSERRLARVLLRLAHNGGSTPGRRNVPRISQATLAAMVGTTRSRISFFLGKFRRMGAIEYDRGIWIDSDRMGAMLGEESTFQSNDMIL